MAGVAAEDVAGGPAERAVAVAEGGGEVELAVEDGVAGGGRDRAGGRGEEFGEEAELGGEIQTDRSRALVALGKLDEAAAALEIARRDSPQNAETWLLSATLARRQGDLTSAQARIETAAGLDPKNPDIGLEAGVIAALAKRDDAARKSFQSVIDTAAGTPEAKAAQGYLDQLGPPPQPAPAAQAGR